jgi:DNA-directed RNA polymerase subunit E'/Rpb7/predicted NAD-dependent protein-ADP-ribosyltransferase YbiA (DUF1768 family)
MSDVKYFKFSTKGKKGQALSNFAELNVTIDERTYKTGEHAFHGSKYFSIAELYDDSKKRKQKLLDYADKFVGEETEFETALDAKKAGSKTKFKMKDAEIELWKSKSIETQKAINKYKYETYPEVREILEKHSNHVLVNTDSRAKDETIWGAKITKEGEMIGDNLLGKLWEETREEMMEPTTTPEFEPTSPVEPPTTPDFEPTSPLEPPPTTPDFEPTSPVEEEPTSPLEKQPLLEIKDDVPLDEETEVTQIELPETRVEKEKRKKISIYNKNILEKRVHIHISEVGNNLTQIIEEKTKKTYENMCTNDGFIKKDSIVLTTYSSGFLENSNIIFDVVFEAMIFRPVEGMIIYNCVVDNISRAGIKAKTNEEFSPVVIFIAKDHAYKSDYYNSINEGDKINIKVIGHRYELKDSKISIIASLVEKRNIKIVLKK